jgi:hypothetical protein
LDVIKVLRTVLGPFARFIVAMTSRLYWVLLAYVVTRAIAVLVMMKLEGWKPVEAYWWGEVSSLTIGYGDYAPKTTAGRLLASPFQFFWVFYCGPAIIGHVVAFLFRNIHILTHSEQEWLFRVTGIMYDWVRWMVLVLQKIALKLGVSDLPPLPHADGKGFPRLCPEQAPDTDFAEQV